VADIHGTLAQSIKLILCLSGFCSTDPTKQKPTKKERNSWLEQPKWTSRKGPNDASVTIPWTKDGRLRYLAIYEHVVAERKLEKEKGEGSLEMKYMNAMKAKLDEEEPGRKKRRITREEDDVEMPIYDMEGNNLVPGEVIGI
jgi:hypothetical protein